MADGTISKVNNAGITPTAKTSTSMTEAAKTVDPAKPETLKAGQTAVREFLNERGAQLKPEATPAQMRESLGKLVGENRPISGAELDAADKILDASEPTTPTTTKVETPTAPVDVKQKQETREKNADIDANKRSELEKNVPTTKTTKTDAAVATVEPGDSLSKIAKKHVNADGTPVTVKQLLTQKENEKFRANPDLIFPGQKVTLPTGAKLKDAPKVDETKVPTTTDGQTPPTTDGQKPPTTDGQTPPTTDGQKPPTTDGQKPPTTDGKTPTETKEAEKNAPIDAAQQQKIDGVVKKIGLAVGPTRGRIASPDGVVDALKGLTPTELKQVKDTYDAKYGEREYTFDRDVRGNLPPAYQRSLAAMEKGDTATADKELAAGKKLMADAKLLYDKGAGDDFGTGEKSIFETLDKYAQDPAAMKELSQEYARQHPGRDMRADLVEDLGGGMFDDPLDASRASALLDGNVDRASAVHVQQQLEQGDYAGAAKTLESVPPAQRKGVAEAFAKQTGTSLESFLASIRGGSTKDRAKLADLAKLFSLAVDAKKTAA
jgi:hypothetical protein